MLLTAPRAPLVAAEVPIPEPGPGQLRVRVAACGVCRTDLHVVDGELPRPKLPLVLGHEVVGRVEALGRGVTRFAIGDRVGIPWLGWTCGTCPACRAGRENLCERARFTGYDLDGGYAEAAVAVAQLARHAGQEVLAFTRPGDAEGQAFARTLGAAWAGGSDERPPAPLDAAILFAPVGALVPAALAATAPGGTVVCAGIHMSDIPSFPYALLWGERTVRSVANLTRRDGEELLALAPRAGVRSAVTTYPLERAGEALADLRGGRLTGAAVVVP